MYLNVIRKTKVIHLGNISLGNKWDLISLKMYYSYLSSEKFTVILIAIAVVLLKHESLCN